MMIMNATGFFRKIMFLFSKNFFVDIFNVGTNELVTLEFIFITHRKRMVFYDLYNYNLSRLSSVHSMVHMYNTKSVQQSIQLIDFDNLCTRRHR